MKNLKLIITLFFLAIGMTSFAKEYKYQTVEGDLLNTRIYTLDNGLKVYLSVNKEKPRLQTYIAVRTGSRNDPAETTGLAHYLEHLMFKGTKQFGVSDVEKEAPLLDSIQNRFEVYRTIKDPAKRKAYYHEIDSISQIAAKYFIPNEYDKLMSSIGAEGTNAYTSDDVTCYTEDIPANEVENWAKIQSDRFQNMVIRGFHTELEAVYEEFNISLSSDARKEWAAIGAMLFPNHPYGTQTTIGTQEHLKNPSIVNIKNYFNRYYVPNNVAICMSGDLDFDKVMAIIDKYFSGWKPNPNLSFPTFAPVRNLTSPVDSTVVGQEAENIMMAWKFDKAASFQTDTLDVIAEILANGKAGLFDLNLNQTMKCKGTGAFSSTMNEYSEFILYGMPQEGQTLDEVKTLMLGEIDKLKKGDFDDDLLPSVVNNMKLAYYRSLDNNQQRADMYVDAFINGKEWKDVVGRLDRISNMTKQQIVDFANRHFLDNYAAVYKVIGTDTTQKKIDKPQITAIPSNRDMQSQFVADIINSETEPIQPRFLDFDKDITKATTKKGLPVLYIQNSSDGLFNLEFRYGFGEESDKWLPFASDYLDYLGTDKMTAEQVKQKLYKLACSYSVSVYHDRMYVRINGLNESMLEALALVEDILANAKVDNEAYNMWVATELKNRSDIKLNQRNNFAALTQYGIYGEYNPIRNIPDSAELVNKNPQELIDLIKNLRNYKHTVLYYGPTTVKEFVSLIDKNHKIAKKFIANPQGKEYTEQLTPKNEIIIAPYDAKNIYMTQYNNAGRTWNPDRQPVIELFNEYFGGGMNTVVFQELRESRGLAYSAWAAYFKPSRPGHAEYSRTNVISQNDKMMDCIRTFNNILDTIPQSEKAFNLAKQALTKRLAAERTTKMSIFNAYLTAQKMGIDYDINEKVYNAIPSITLNDVVKFEQETMANKPFRYLILGDENNLDIKSLEKIAPIKRVSTEDIFGY
ncbi:MAG: insulinase family protein [Prevotellaceae bacterium]|nr:insulinase family protein [Prevotellaceae bacterium]